MKNAYYFAFTPGGTMRKNLENSKYDNFESIPPIECPDCSARIFPFKRQDKVTGHYQKIGKKGDLCAWDYSCSCGFECFGGHCFIKDS